MDIVTLATYSDAVQAELAKVFLESEDIECFIADSNAGSMQFMGAVSVGVRIQVSAEDQDRARELLDKFVKDKSHEIDDDALMTAFEEDAAIRGEAIFEIPREEPSLTVTPEHTPDTISDSEPTCPKCGGTRLVKEREFTFGLSLLSVILLGLPLLFIKPKLKCKRCRYDLG